MLGFKDGYFRGELCEMTTQYDQQKELSLFKLPYPSLGVLDVNSGIQDDQRSMERFG